LIYAAAKILSQNKAQKQAPWKGWLSATYIPNLDAEGKVIGFFSMIDDTTERKAVKRMKSKFISIASHEMRTPLTSIINHHKIIIFDG